MSFVHVEICSHLMSLWLWQVQSSVIPGLNVQIQDHLGITALVQAAGKGFDWGPFHRLGQRMFQWLPDVVLHGSWLVLG